MKKWLSGIYKSFPVQLLILHFKKDHVFLLIWFLIIFGISGLLGRSLGVHYTFLDPEYLGDVNFISFLMIGVSLGSLFVTWNISSYMINSVRFPFLATLEYPLWHYSLNNFIIPLFVFVYYSIAIVWYQSTYELRDFTSIFFGVEGLLIGILIVFALTALYFYLTNKNILSFMKKLGNSSKGQKYSMKKNKRWNELVDGQPVHQVSSFLSSRLKSRPVRSVAHYDKNLLLRIFRQHHHNALYVQLASLAILLLLGFLIDVPIFQIPAAASLIFVFCLIIVLAGAVSYWLGHWRVTLFIVILIVVNWLSGFTWLTEQNVAYGMNYDTTRAVYSLEQFDSIFTDKKANIDIRETEGILDNWKKKATKINNQKKPPIILASFSGGGMRSSLWAMRVLQYADSLSNGKFMKHSSLMTGASGGMLGAAYFRELYLQHELGDEINYRDFKYVNDISKDILNPVIFTLLVNDLFYPWQQFEFNEHTYFKDRGYSMEQKYNEHTNFLMDKKIRDYAKPEKDGTIPMMILTPTIVNDKRQLVISPHSMTYMTRPISNGFNSKSGTEYDCVDFQTFFADQDAEGLRFTTALRMNATFPYILPTVYLPSDPPLEIIDAGLRDNYGLSTNYRFIYTFKEWLINNVSEVIVLDIRTNQKFETVNDYQPKTLLGKFFTPLAAVYQNNEKLTDFIQDDQAVMLNDILKDKLNVIRFEYRPEKISERASMSFHLTEKEKLDILKSIYLDTNQEGFMRLLELIL